MSTGRNVAGARRAGRPARHRAELAAGIASLFCYLNVLPNDYCYDDLSTVRDSPAVNEPGGWSLIWAWDYWRGAGDTSPQRDLLYRPITVGSFRVIRQIFGVDPLPQHAGNVLLHVLVSVLVARFCRRIGMEEEGALVGGVLFAVLPIHTEVVASVVGRADLLAAAGVLCSLLVYRRFLRAGRAIGELFWLGVSCAAAFAAFGAKESALGLVVLHPLFGSYWGRSEPRPARKWTGEFDCAAPENAARPRGLKSTVLHFLPRASSIRLRELLPYGRGSVVLSGALSIGCVLVAAGAYLALRYHALGSVFHQTPPLSKSINVLAGAPAWQHVLGAVQLWGMYWAKTLWPSVLSCTYSVNAIRLATGLFEPHVLLGLIAGTVLIAWSAIAWRRGVPQVALLSAAVVIAYAPMSNVFVLIRVFFAERIWYVPSIFVAGLAGAAWCQVRRQRFARLEPVAGGERHTVAPRGGAGTEGGEGGVDVERITFGLWRGTILWTAAILAAGGMVGRCWIRCADWRHNGVLFQSAYEAHPNSVAALHLYGEWLAGHGDLQRGMELLRRAVEIDLGYTHAWRALGKAYYDAGQYEQALEHFRIAQMQLPDDRGTAELFRLTQEKLAEQLFERLRRLQAEAEAAPGNVEAHQAWIRGLLEAGRNEEALTRLQEGEKRFGEVFEWNLEYAVTLVHVNRLDDAIERYRRALRFGPKHAQASIELAMLLLERGAPGDLDEARTWATRAYEAAPAKPEVLACLAEVAAAEGHVGEAVEWYERALALLAADSPMRRVFEQRARILGMK